MQPPSGRSSRARSHRRVSPYPARGNVAHQDTPEDEEAPDTAFTAEQAASGGFAQVLRTAAGAESQGDCELSTKFIKWFESALLLASPQTYPSLLELVMKLGKPCSSASRSEALSRSCKQPLELDAAKNKPCKSESQPESSPQTCPSLVEQATTKDKQCQSALRSEALSRSCNQPLELDAAKNKLCKSESQPESSPQTCPSLVEKATTKSKQCQSESQPEALPRSCKQLLELH
ncbi:hypothetical protein PR003_g31978 [Phytophthora rubi]|uniref:Uncharacterized protein n=2 Tax=Phytophthora rubi TaxID=129364 RepID=A0A6A4B884_9STRA|nr:hypothetical protein PR003_g31978 [Phytophthora rubi]